MSTALGQRRSVRAKNYASVRTPIEVSNAAHGSTITRRTSRGHPTCSARVQASRQRARIHSVRAAAGVDLGDSAAHSRPTCALSQHPRTARDAEGLRAHRYAIVLAFPATLFGVVEREINSAPEWQGMRVEIGNPD